MKGNFSIYFDALSLFLWRKMKMHAQNTWHCLVVIQFHRNVKCVTIIAQRCVHEFQKAFSSKYWILISMCYNVYDTRMCSVLFCV